MTAGKRAIASNELTSALINLAARGERTHCSDPESHHLWLSDDESDRAVAAVKLAKLIDSNRHGRSGAAQNVKAHREALAVALQGAGKQADVITKIFASQD